MKLAAPLYVYPGAKWDPFLIRLPQLIVANPASGPGAQAAAMYTAYLKKARDLGIETYGYVDLDYMNIPLAQVFTWVDQWVAYYPGLITGVFYDEYDKTGTQASLIRAQAVYDYARSKGLKVITNPGTTIGAAYLPFCDYTMVFEGTAKDWLLRTLPVWCSDPALGKKAWYCVHTCAADQLALVKAKLATLNQGVAWITPDTMANPYDTIPPVEYLSTVEVIPGPIVTPPAPQPVVYTAKLVLQVLADGKVVLTKDIV